MESSSGLKFWLRNVIFGLCAHIITGFYLRTSEPTLFCQNGGANCKNSTSVVANHLTSSLSALTYQPDRLGLCLFENSHEIKESLGRYILGDRLEEMQIKLQFGKYHLEEQLCTQTLKQGNHLDALKEAVYLQYSYHLYIDGLPVTHCSYSGVNYCTTNIPFGCYIDRDGRQTGYCTSSTFEHDTYYIYNHLRLTIEYEPRPSTQSAGLMGHIVSATAEPLSQKRGQGGFVELVKFSGGHSDEAVTFPFTYDVTWKESKIHWENRWDSLLAFESDKVLMFSLVNGVVVLLFSLIFAAMTLLRTYPRFHKLHSVLKWLNDKSLVKRWRMDEDAWKELSEDVFRPPKCSALLSAITGTGIQILSTILVILVAGCTGYISPANPDMLGNVMLYSYLCGGLINGFVAIRVYNGVRTAKENKTLKVFFLSALLCPGFLFSLFLLLNMVHVVKDSSSAIGLPYLWELIGISTGTIGAVGMGVFFGYRKCLKVLDNSEPSHLTPRELCIQRTPVQILIQGILPFSSCFIASFFLLSHVWNGQAFYAYWYLLTSFLITVGQAFPFSWHFCFYQFCRQNHHWWWRTFSSGIGTALYFFVYSIYFYIKKTGLTGFASVVIYFGYALIISILIYFVIGSVCFLFTWAFVIQIYKNLHQERMYAGVMECKPQSPSWATKEEGEPGMAGDDGPDRSLPADDSWDTLEEWKQPQSA